MSLQFPQTYTPDQVRLIARLHSLTGEPTLLPNSGMVNEAWLVGDYVIRIIRDAESDDEAEREAWVVPLVMGAGVPTPELIAADIRKGIVPRPFTIYRRAKGVSLADAPQEPSAYTELYRELGRVIAKIGRIEVPEEQRSKLRGTAKLDAAEQLQKSFDAGALAPSDKPQVERIIALLQDENAPEGKYCFAHRDIHPWNFFIDPQSGELEAIIDWGDAAWGDPAMEFASMPLFALPNMIEGYREAGSVYERQMLVRTLETGLALALWEIRGLDQAVFKRQWWRCSADWETEERTISDLLSKF